jgi:hypothetical protein
LYQKLSFFPKVKAKTPKKIKMQKEVTFAEETDEHSRRSSRIASKTKVDYEQLVKGLQLGDEESCEVYDDGDALQQLFLEEPNMSTQGEKKMVTIPSDEGYRVILPNLTEHLPEQVHKL